MVRLLTVTERQISVIAVISLLETSGTNGNRAYDGSSLVETKQHMVREKSNGQFLLIFLRMNSLGKR